MADVLHSAQSIVGGHAAAVAGGTAGFLTGTDKAKLDGLGLAPSIIVHARTTAALPAYTFTSGGAGGVGDTFEYNANGAMATLDGVTLVANDPVKGAFLMQHGANAADNGPMMLIVQGSGGTKAKWIRHPYCDTAGKIFGSRVRVAAGAQFTGAEYAYTAAAAITIGTTKIYYKRSDGRRRTNEGFCTFEDFAGNVVAATGTANYGAGQYQIQTPTGSAVAVGTVGGTAIGEIGFTTGTSNTGFGGVLSSISGATTGHAFTLTGAVGLEFDVRLQSTTLSTAVQEYALNVGYVKQQAAGQGIPSDCVAFVYARSVSVNLLAVCSLAGTPTTVDTGIVYNAAQRYRLQAVLDAGSGSVRFYIDGVLVATISTNVPIGAPLSFQAAFYKSVGTTSVAALTVDWVSEDVHFPELRAA